MCCWSTFCVITYHLWSLTNVFEETFSQKQLPQLTNGTRGELKRHTGECLQASKVISEPQTTFVYTPTYWQAFSNYFETEKRKGELVGLVQKMVSHCRINSKITKTILFYSLIDAFIDAKGSMCILRNMISENMLHSALRCALFVCLFAIFPPCGHVRDAVD